MPHDSFYYTPSASINEPAIPIDERLEQYARAEISVTPVAARGKAAILRGWSKRDLSPDELTRMFAGKNLNIGLRLGEPSGHLVDVDIDCKEALAIADTFLSSTPAVFGRPSKPRSHQLYRAAVKRTMKFSDPVREKEARDGKKEGEKLEAMIVELRSNKSQTAGPGSIHESGEQIDWASGDRENVPPPAEVDPEVLQRQAALLATAALLGRYYPPKGVRHTFELGLAGGLLRGGVSEDDAIDIITAIAIVDGVGSDGSATITVRGTQVKIDRREPTIGWPAVIEALGDHGRTIVQTVTKWLHISSNDNRRNPDDFVAYLPTHKYLDRVTQIPWEGKGVNEALDPIADGTNDDGATRWCLPTVWLDRNRPVHQKTWIPGHPEYIENKYVDEGGLVERVGMRVYNDYRAPVPVDGAPSKATRWVEMVQRLFPDDWEHIVPWFAHRVQRPGEKINHALVLGGRPGIGKDTIIGPLVAAVGRGNFKEASPTNLLERFNEYLKSVVLRVSEARDLGEASRYGFYEHMKTIIAAPPDTLRVDEKYMGAFYIPNVTGVLYTTNNRINGLYLPRDDRRHYVAWSEAVPWEVYSAEHFTEMWRWYQDGGFGHVRAYLAAYDLSTFDPKAPPPKTPAFWELVNTNETPETSDLEEVLEAMCRPQAVTITQVVAKIKDLGQSRIFGEIGDFWELSNLLTDRKYLRQVPHVFKDAGYVRIRNTYAKDGKWVIDGKRQPVYALMTLSTRERLLAARAMMTD